jgi:hypothetical protein
MKRSEVDDGAEAKALSSRLLAAAARQVPRIEMTWDQVEAAIRREGPPPRRIRLRTALAVGVALILSSSAASVALSHGGLLRRALPAVAEPSPRPPKPAARRPRVRVAMKGPGTAVWDEEQGTVTLSGEIGAVTSEGAPATVSFAGREWQVAPGHPLDFTSPSPAQPSQPLAPRSAQPSTAPSTQPLPSPPALRPTPGPRAGAGSRGAALAPVERGARLVPAPTSVEPSRRVEKPEPLLLLPPGWAEEAGLAAGPDLTLVKDALHDLRVRQNASAALARLEGHVGRFSDQALEDVAVLLRIEALLALGRTREAWVRLEALPDPTVSRTRGVLLARAELRALHGHCADALADLARMGQLSGAWDVRASHVRAWCAAGNP